MTSNNGFKKKVRARMKLTGETYTEAYRNLLKEESVNFAQYFSRGMLSKVELDNAQLVDLFSETEYERLKDALSDEYGSAIFSGLIGSGRTTTMNLALKFLQSWFPEERHMVIEHDSEILVDTKAYVVASSKDINDELSISDLVVSALRMRADRLIIGEIREPETVNALKFQPYLATLHASNFINVLDRLERLGGVPENLSVIVEHEKFKDGDSYLYLHSVIVLTDKVRAAVEKYLKNGNASELLKTVENEDMMTLAEKKKKLIKANILRTENGSYIVERNR